MQQNRLLMLNSTECYPDLDMLPPGSSLERIIQTSGKTNYAAHVMNRFLYRGLFCRQPPDNDVNEKFLSMGRPDEYLNRCHQFFGLHYSRLFADTYTTCLHNAVLQWLYKGKDPIKREPVVLLAIKDTSKLNPFR